MAEIISGQKRQIAEWLRNRRNLTCLLNQMCDELEEHYRNTRIASLTGTSASVGGLLLTGAGFLATLATGGLAAPLVVGGALTSLAGFGVSSGTKITKHIIKKQNVSIIDKALEEDKDMYSAIEKRYEEIYKRYNKDDVSFQDFMQALKDVQTQSLSDDTLNRFHYGAHVGKHAFNVAKVYRGIKLINTGKTAMQAGRPLFTTLSTLSKASLVGGLVIGTITLPLDILAISRYINELTNETAPEIVQKIRRIIRDLEIDTNLTPEQYAEEEVNRFLSFLQ